MAPGVGTERSLARHVGEVLCAARGERSSREVAEALGWRSHRNLLAIEAGQDNPTLDRLQGIARALGGDLMVKFVFAGEPADRVAFDPEWWDFGPAWWAKAGTERPLARHVGEVLCAARGERSYREVAEALGWRTHINLMRVEAGQDNPTLDRLQGIACALGGDLIVKFVVTGERQP